MRVVKTGKYVLSEWNSSDEKLLRAVKKRSQNSARQVIYRKSVNPTKVDPTRGITALHLAASKGYSEIVEDFLSLPIDLNVRDVYGRTALQTAVRNARYDITKRLLQDDVDIDVIDHDGWSALHHACFGGHINCVMLLLEFGALVDIPDKRGRTPLLYAAWKGQASMCRILLDNRANINHTDNEMRTALMLAADRGTASVCEYLISRGALVDCTDNQGHSALWLAAKHDNKELNKLLQLRHTTGSQTIAVAGDTVDTPRAGGSMKSSICNGNHLVGTKQHPEKAPNGTGGLRVTFSEPETSSSKRPRCVAGAESRDAGTTDFRHQESTVADICQLVFRCTDLIEPPEDFRSNGESPAAAAVSAAIQTDSVESLEHDLSMQDIMHEYIIILEAEKLGLQQQLDEMQQQTSAMQQVNLELDAKCVRLRSMLDWLHAELRHLYHFLDALRCVVQADAAVAELEPTEGPTVDVREALKIAVNRLQSLLSGMTFETFRPYPAHRRADTSSPLQDTTTSSSDESPHMELLAIENRQLFRQIETSFGPEKAVRRISESSAVDTEGTEAENTSTVSRSFSERQRQAFSRDEARILDDAQSCGTLGSQKPDDIISEPVESVSGLESVIATEGDIQGTAKSDATGDEDLAAERDVSQAGVFVSSRHQVELTDQVGKDDTAKQEGVDDEEKELNAGMWELLRKETVLLQIQQQSNLVLRRELEKILKRNRQLQELIEQLQAQLRDKCRQIESMTRRIETANGRLDDQVDELKRVLRDVTREGDAEQLELSQENERLRSTIDRMQHVLESTPTIPEIETDDVMVAGGGYGDFETETETDDVHVREIPEVLLVDDLTGMESVVCGQRAVWPPNIMLASGKPVESFSERWDMVETSTIKYSSKRIYPSPETGALRQRGVETAEFFKQRQGRGPVEHEDAEADVVVSARYMEDLWLEIDLLKRTIDDQNQLLSGAGQPCDVTSETAAATVANYDDSGALVYSDESDDRRRRNLDESEDQESKSEKEYEVAVTCRMVFDKPSPAYEAAAFNLSETSCFRSVNGKREDDDVGFGDHSIFVSTSSPVDEECSAEDFSADTNAHQLKPKNGGRSKYVTEPTIVPVSNSVEKFRPIVVDRQRSRNADDDEDASTRWETSRERVRPTSVFHESTGSLSKTNVSIGEAGRTSEENGRHIEAGSSSLAVGGASEADLRRQVRETSQRYERLTRELRYFREHVTRDDCHVLRALSESDFTVADLRCILAHFRHQIEQKMILDDENRLLVEEIDRLSADIYRNRLGTELADTWTTLPVIQEEEDGAEDEVRVQEECRTAETSTRQSVTLQVGPRQAFGAAAKATRKDRFISIVCRDFGKIVDIQHCLEESDGSAGYSGVEVEREFAGSQRTADAVSIVASESSASVSRERSEQEENVQNTVSLNKLFGRPRYANIDAGAQIGETDARTAGKSVLSSEATAQTELELMRPFASLVDAESQTHPMSPFATEAIPDISTDPNRTRTTEVAQASQSTVTSASLQPVAELATATTRGTSALTANEELLMAEVGRLRHSLQSAERAFEVELRSRREENLRLRTELKSLQMKFWASTPLDVRDQLGEQIENMMMDVERKTAEIEQWKTKYYTLQDDFTHRQFETSTDVVDRHVYLELEDRRSLSAEPDEREALLRTAERLRADNEQLVRENERLALVIEMEKLKNFSTAVETQTEADEPQRSRSPDVTLSDSARYTACSEDDLASWRTWRKQSSEETYSFSTPRSPRRTLLSHDDLQAVIPVDLVEQMRVENAKLEHFVFLLSCYMNQRRQRSTFSSAFRASSGFASASGGRVTPFDDDPMFRDIAGSFDSAGHETLSTSADFVPASSLVGFDIDPTDTAVVPLRQAVRVEDRHSTSGTPDRAPEVALTLGLEIPISIDLGSMDSGSSSVPDTLFLVAHLQRKLQENERNYHDVVHSYRRHLLSAIQGRLDPDVKSALLNITQLRHQDVDDSDEDIS